MYAIPYFWALAKLSIKSDKVLLHKVRISLSHQYSKLIASCLDDRYFQVKYADEVSDICPINAGVQQ